MAQFSLLYSDNQNFLLMSFPLQTFQAICLSFILESLRGVLVTVKGWGRNVQKIYTNPAPKIFIFWGRIDYIP